ncbi:sigma-54 dependent transcriptional regulator [Kaistia dalseonensis]|uniref:Two-component system repressor protein LuxO n=1 Tax=Kaistia dalseonensis TaxID=410840 RepID=A0ABU0HCE3_9HYPH|nr:sigma-54 dependent transcriptional regulator [Kaistia dalseonensis]MCX5497345.1 sigma-54 dependent transcriptional regulator [Kaistia dalseonensis]MDQ0439982.1 two-component system repressor protein LuxO [Kaistia dalseonensis]
MGFAEGSQEPVHILIVDADPVQRRMVAAHLASRPGPLMQSHAVATRAEALECLSGEAGQSIVVADMETLGGAEALSALAGGSASVIVTSARGSVHAAVAAIRAGAVDFLPKPYGPATLIERIEAAIAGWGRAERSTPARTPAAPSNRDGFSGFIGRSAAMRAVYDQIERIAPSRAPVFVTGESGTGKELCAEAIHARSGREGKPFVAINCSAIPRDLMESEIFGHVRGAFTGATETRAGAAEMADGGTLFLDEIGEMDLALQAKLLRFVQSGTVQRVGDATVRRVDVRIVSATNRDPFAEIAAGRFREDLFYRLHVLPIHLPPLRDRGSDIMDLATSFLQRYAAEEARGFEGFTIEAADLLMRHDWPGNVRELQNAIRRMVVLHQGREVTAPMLPPTIRGETPSRPGQPAKAGRGADPIAPFWEQERSIIESAVGAYSGNIARAAAALEISPSTIYRKRQAWLERRTA